MESSRLKIYRASAGSGKTFTLTAEYIRMLLEHPDPFGYRHILAVTFTNKATGEMKNRILSELHLLSRNKESGILDYLLTHTALSRQEICTKAKKLLNNILEEYSSFRVQTIDSFFQEVVRSFAMEISQNSAYTIEMDKDLVVSLSVEMLIDRLDSEESSITMLRDWLRKLFAQSINEGHNFNPLKEIKSLASSIFFDETNRPFIENISLFTPQNIEQMRDKLLAREQILAGNLVSKSQAVVEFCANMGFSYTDISYNTFKKIEMMATVEDVLHKYCPPHPLFSDRARKMAAGESSLMSTAKKKEYGAFDEEALRLLLGELISASDEMLLVYQTDVEILKGLNILPALALLIKDIETYRRENNCLLISDIGHLLQEIIQGATTPFIYEKVGSQIMHYMIDEFQDTSPLQWQNFSPLLIDSLDQGHENLIVGDVKQSIYRFRGTDSSLLGSKVEHQLGKRYIQKKTLTHNWRSQKRIIDFNNRFFTDIYNINHIDVDLPDSLQSKSDVFDDAYQETPEKALDNDRGYVSITKIDSESEDPEQWLQEQLETLIFKLQSEQGFKAQDIALLVRRRKEAVMLADMLGQMKQKADIATAHYFDFISDEALLIKQSPIVLLLVCLLRCYAAPGNSMHERALSLHIERYRKIYPHSSPSLTTELLLSLAIQGQSLYETITEALTNLGEVPLAERSYVNALLDVLFQFVSNKQGSFSDFLEWWDSESGKLMITMGEATLNRITIITIHKAKGLEYPVVIMPFANWDIVGGGSVQATCIPSTLLPQEYQDLPYYIINAKASRTRSSYLRPYLNTLLAQHYADTLNLLYVAFTRASEELHIFLGEMKRSGKNCTKTIIEQRLLEISTSDQKESYSSDGVWDSGTPVFYSEHSKSNDGAHQEIFTMKHQSHADDLMISPQGYARTFEKDRDRIRGIVLHKVLSHTRNIEDFAPLLRKEVSRGTIDRDEAQRLQQIFDHAMQDPMIANWFSGKDGTILCEQQIHTGKYNYRPDRVIIQGNNATVIDYKFTKSHTSRHEKQVREYLDLLSQMGYDGTLQGYLWYNLGSSHDIVKV